jgi:glucose/mannose-6-phosphate isomerase
MGGSAIGGALLQGLVADECDVPIALVRGYDLPAFAHGPKTLVVASSYSGNTEETLSCFRQALRRKTRAIAITTGGELANMAREARVPVIHFQYESQPRAALGYSFILLLGMAYRLGLIHDYTEDVAEAARVMLNWQDGIRVQVPMEDNLAKKTASRIAGRLPVIFGAGFLTAVANRWKTQFNENAKQWAFFEMLPELNHNAVVGFESPAVVQENSIVLMLRSDLDLQRVKARWDVTRQLLGRVGVASQEFYGRGESPLAQMLSLIHIGDFISFYLAMLGGVDPTPVEAIAFLKQRLAQSDHRNE